MGHPSFSIGGDILPWGEVGHPAPQFFFGEIYCTGRSGAPGGGANFYDYVRGRPTHFVDPSGLIHQAPDGRLHDDASGGLEVLCTKGRNRAQDIEWLEQSIAVRSAEIAALGHDADIGHIDRLNAELATLKKCKECEDEDKQKEPDAIDVNEWEQWFERNKKMIEVGALGTVIVGGAIILAPATGGGSLGVLAFVP